ncbi:MAG TPA: SMP-30/gluconolactonase/LRE family protein [Gaiellaceae bacterium]|nr:SMP-30/gluconolactonase/LRE family protein [Gaiellaceae bacterium]
MRIRAGAMVVAALLLAAAVGSAATAKRPEVSLASSRAGAVAGRPWTAVLHVRGSRPAALAVTATLGRRRVAATARRAAGDRYRARIVFPAPGRWTLTARLGGKRFPLGTIVVRAPAPMLLVYPTEAVLEPSGSLLVAESGRSRIVRIDLATGRDTSVARIVQPYGIVLTSSGTLFATSESRVVRVGSGGGTTAIADAREDVGPLAIDPAGNLYFSTVARIFRIDGGTGAVIPYAGTGTRGGGGDGGPALQAEVDAPHGLAVGPDGALFVADTGNDRVRRIDPATQVITAYAAATRPAGLAFDADGALYVAERDGYRVSRVDRAGTKAVVAGTGVRGNSGDGGPATAARLDEPFDVVTTANGTLLVLQSGAAGRLRLVDPSGKIQTVRRR